MSSKNKRRFLSPRRLLAAFVASVAGLRCVFAQEAAFRLEVAIVVILLPVALFADIAVIEKLLLIITLLLVLLTELINSAVEAAVDWTAHQLPPESRRHSLAAKAKDAASAAVFVAVVIAAVVWLAVFWRG